jgi:thiol:disulfide interchange protein
MKTKTNKRIGSIKAGILALILILGLSIPAMVSSQNKDEHSSEKGIHFFQGSWEEAIAEAKKQDKPIFLDVYATWCGPCKALKARTFPNEDVGKYFNEHFINVSLNGEKGDGIQVKKELNIHSYPSLFVLNSDGKPLVYTAGFMSPDDLIKLGKTGVKEYKFEN